MSLHRESSQRHVLVLLISAASLAATPVFMGCHKQPELTPQQAQGKHLYEVRCAHCHRDNDLALKKVPPDLHDIFKGGTLPSGAPASDTQVKQTILAGKGLMPAFVGRFNDAQMEALLAYLHTGLR